MAKQTYYEILGTPQDATANAIEQAYAEQKRLLQAHPDMEHRRNRLAFLQHARDVLVDGPKRASYDLQLQAEKSIVIADIPSSSTFGRTLLLSVLAGCLLLLWNHYHNQKNAPPPAGNETMAANRAPIPLGNNDDKDIVFEIAPDKNEKPQGSATTGNALVAAPALPAKRAYQIQTSATDADLVKKLVWSVYAVVGPKAFGTGVMVDADHLLTNCHVIAANVRSGKMYAVNAVTRDKVEITEVAYLDHQDACLIRASGMTGQTVAINNFAQPLRGFKTHNIGYASGTLISSEGEFTGWAYKFGQKFMVTSNYCDHGVSGGPLVDDDGRLVGLTSGGPPDKSYCLSVTSDTINSLKFEPSRPLDQFPDNYTSNVSRRS